MILFKSFVLTLTPINIQLLVNQKIRSFYQWKNQRHQTSAKPDWVETKNFLFVVKVNRLFILNIAVSNLLKAVTTTVNLLLNQEDCFVVLAGESLTNTCVYVCLTLITDYSMIFSVIYIFITRYFKNKKNGLDDQKLVTEGFDETSNFDCMTPTKIRRHSSDSLNDYILYAS